MKTKSGTETVQDATNAAVNEILLNTEAELFAAAGMQREHRKC